MEFFTATPYKEGSRGYMPKERHGTNHTSITDHTIIGNDMYILEKKVARALQGVENRAFVVCTE